MNKKKKILDIDQIRYLLEILTNYSFDNFNDETLQDYITFLLLEEYEIDSKSEKIN